MRVSTYDAAALEAQLGPRDGTTGVVSANRHLVQNWLVANGVPSARAKAMKLATLWKCYNKPRYLSAVLAHLGKPELADPVAWVNRQIARFRDDAEGIAA